MEVIDLTASDDEMESSSPKRPQANSPPAPPVSDRAPVLELAIPIPDFRTAEVAESYFTASSAPPILEPEVKPVVLLPENSSTIPIPHSSSTTLSASAQANNVSQNPVQQDLKVSAIPTFVNIGRKQVQRSARGDGSPQETKQILQKTIAALKNQESRNNTKERKFQKGIPHFNPGSDIPTKRQRRTRAKRSSEKFAGLEIIFAINPNPTSSEFAVISSDTGLSIKEVKAWYATANKKLGNANQVNRSPSYEVSDPRLSGSVVHSRSQVNETYQQAGPSGVHTNASSPKENFSSGTIQKFIRLGKRTQDVEIIKRDIKKVKDCSAEEFESILNQQWNFKANRLLSLIDNNTLMKGMKETIYKEARRLKDLASNFSPLSEEQDMKIAEWKKSFIEDKCTTEEEKANVNHAVEQAIMPWIVPFIYARCTLQDQRNLTLEVALSDFCKISNNCADWNWQTPCFLQVDFTSQTKK